jgi:hypothetical protein
MKEVIAGLRREFCKATSGSVCAMAHTKPSASPRKLYIAGIKKASHNSLLFSRING